MAGVKFSINAAKQIQQAVQGYLGEPIDQTGLRPRRLSFNERGFWSKVTGNAPVSGGSSGGPYYYAWTEQYDSGTNTLADKPSGRSGTTSMNQGVNGWEQSTAGAGSPPIPNGTIVWMVLSFDNADPANPVWRFNQLPPAVFPVKVSTDGGSAGSMSGGTNCDFTYTVFAEDGSTQLATGKTPEITRYTNCKYDTPSTKSPGLAYLDSSGAIHLYSVAQEKPSGKVVTNITNFQVVDSSKSLEIKTQNQLVLDAADESGWTTVYTGSSC